MSIHMSIPMFRHMSIHMSVLMSIHMFIHILITHMCRFDWHQPPPGPPLVLHLRTAPPVPVGW